MVKRIESLGHRLGFTKNEAIAILFLAGMTAGGGVLHLLRGNRQPSFDEAYAAHDSTFVTLSAARIPADTAVPGRKADPEAAATSPRAPIRVDINEAGESELVALPGIGPSTAKKIIAYRLDVGKFEKIEDIMRVKTIGSKKFERMKAHIYVK